MAWAPLACSRWREGCARPRQRTISAAATRAASGGHLDHYRLLIDGELVEGSQGERIESIDPGSGRPVATYALATASDAEAAVGAARRAFDGGGWSRKTPLERAEILLELADLIQADSLRLADLEARDSGGVIGRTHGDVFMGAKFLRSMANYAANHFPWREVGEVLCSHPHVDKIAFTGSTEVGRRILELLAKLAERARTIRVGYQLDPKTQLGPVVSAD